MNYQKATKKMPLKLANIFEIQTSGSSRNKMHIKEDIFKNQ